MVAVGALGEAEGEVAGMAVEGRVEAGVVEQRRTDTQTDTQTLRQTDTETLRH